MSTDCDWKLPYNDHPFRCSCAECFCAKCGFSLRRPAKPPHGWRYKKCPLCRAKEIKDVVRNLGKW